MNPKRKKLLLIVIFIVAGMGAATGLALKAFQENLLYFYSPAQVRAGEPPEGRKFRLGGLVLNGSVRRESGALEVRFDVADNTDTLTVAYAGVLPDLFREGQGIVANGRMGKDGTFVASEVLAKHDEKYMPPEVADALKKAGVKHNYGKYRLR